MLNCSSKIFANFSQIVPETMYLGGVVNYRGDLSNETRTRILAAKRAWLSFRGFWTRQAVPRTFRITVYKGLVRSTLLSGLEAVPLTPTQCAEFEKFQMKCARSLACGEACLKFPRVLPGGRVENAFHC